MALLPEIRIWMSMHAFAQTAVDYGGPFTTVQGRGKHRQKRSFTVYVFINESCPLGIAYGVGY